MFYFEAFMQGQAASRSNYHLTLGKMISTLEALPNDVKVGFDTGGSPETMTSYRGYYSDIGVTTGGETLTVETFLQRCKLILGTELEGWKGGMFLMEEHTPLWKAQTGDASDVAILGTLLHEDTLILITRKVD